MFQCPKKNLKTCQNLGASNMGILKEIKKYKINTGDRWPEGIDHHPKSEEIVNALSEIDFEFFNDYFCWKLGGDGDNGESLMYQLDIWFDLQDAKQNAK